MSFDGNVYYRTKRQNAGNPEWRTTSILASATSHCSLASVNNISLADHISIYPNPSAGEVFVITELSNINSMDVKVYNAIGQIVFSKKINLPSAKVDLSNNPNGIYLFELKTSEGNITKKVILNR